MTSAPPRAPLTADAAEFARLYDDEQLSIRGIADRTGHSYRYVRARLIEADVEFRENTRRQETEALAADFAALYRRGLSIRGIRARTGYSYRYIHALLDDAGVVFRDHAGQPRKAAA
ncbi:helix-turn-helix domain-containing protein [Streptomyces sp. NPDC004763]